MVFHNEKNVDFHLKITVNKITLLLFRCYNIRSFYENNLECRWELGISCQLHQLHYELVGEYYYFLLQR